MKPSPPSAFDCFIANRIKDLQRISRYTRGEQQLADVINQSWLMARQMSTNETLEELYNQDFQDPLLRRLNNFFASHADRALRKSISLHYGSDDTGASWAMHASHTSVQALTPANSDPLSELLNHEEISSTIQVEDPAVLDCSLAGAYICLLEHFDRSWRKVAEHLRVSTLTARKHYHHAEFLACHQLSLPSHMPKGFMPGPWRSSRPKQPLRQLLFEFAYQLTFSCALDD